MFSLRKLLYDIENIEQEKNAVIQPSITIEDLHNTSESLEKLASPDREIDVMAKFAVLMDMGLEKTGISLKDARKFLWKSQDEIRAAEIVAQTKKNLEKVERIQKGKTLGDYKGRILAGTGALGAYYLGTKKSGSNKKDELRGVARKYFSLGRQSTGGA
jgi:hypothetical protein